MYPNSLEFIKQKRTDKFQKTAATIIMVIVQQAVYVWNTLFIFGAQNDTAED